MTRLLISNLTRISLVAFLGVAAAVPGRSDLIHEYLFNGNVNDQVLTGSLNGTPVGDATASGGVLSLDGEGDYVTFGGNIVPGGTGDFSILLAARFVFGSAEEFISQGGSASGRPFYIGPYGNEMRLGDNYYNWNATPAGGNDCGHCTDIASPTDNNWHNYALVMSSGTASFYIDGTLRGFRVGYDVGAGNTAFGTQYVGGEYLNGQLRDIQVYNNAVSFDQVQGYGGAPEPGTAFLAGAALLAVSLIMRRKQSA